MKKHSKRAILVVWAAMVMGVAGVTNSIVIYHEIFTSAGSTRDLPFDGWKAYEGSNGSAWSGPNFAHSTGSTEYDSVNSSPVYPDEVHGYMYGYAHTGKASFIWTDEYIFSLKMCDNLRFSARHNDADTEDIRAAIKVGQSWYVSSPVATTYGAGWAEAQKWIVDADSVTWYSLDFTAGSTMSVGSAVTFPSEGIVNGFGWYIDEKNFDRSLRLDNYKIEGAVLTLSPLYHEIFTSAGSTRDLPFGGWKAYEGSSGSAWSGPNFAQPSGSTEYDSVNSSPVYPDEVYGYMYGYAHTGKASFIWTDEYTFSLKTWKNIRFSARHNDANTEDIRAAIKVGQSWYVSSPVTTTYGAGWAEAQKWIVDADCVTWYSLDFTAGSTMSVGSAVTFPGEGIVNGFGWYIDEKNFDRSLRLDNYKIEGAVLTLSLDSLTRIWSSAHHNAFTDLIQWNNDFYCIFREGTSHVSKDGKLRILKSSDLSNWSSYSLITYTPPPGSTHADLREAHFSVTALNQLMINAIVTLWNGDNNQGSQSISYLSTYGFSSPFELNDPKTGWLWKVEWKGDYGYGFKYASDYIRLYYTTNGQSIAPIGSYHFTGTGRLPSETHLAFEGDRMLVLARCDGTPAFSQLGSAEPPYDDVEWWDTNCTLDCPELIMMPNGQFVAAVRLYADGRHSALTLVQEDLHSVSKVLLDLPSGSWDCGYCGMVLYNGKLYVSYYSDHELNKACIYIAEVSYSY